MGMIPNLIATMARSNAVARAYLAFSQALSKGKLDTRLREGISLAVAEKNRCGYCLSAHSAIGKKLGLTDSEVEDARRGNSVDPQEAAVLEFARKVLESRGSVSDEDIERLRQAGICDEIVLEIVGNVVLNIYTNYVNLVAGTEIDFPVAKPL